MIPREAGRGRSFVGAGKYYLHDRGAETSERVAFTHTENVPTGDPHKALKWMAWTAIHADELKRDSGAAPTGRSCARPVFCFSLAWHPEQQPKKWEMIGAGQQALQALGLDEHETVMAAHQERQHPHLHLIVNLVHPETGKASRLSYSRLKLSRWAEEYEREHGVIYCAERVENNAKRKEGEKVQHREPELDVKAKITELYQTSDSGEAFRAALAENGFTLARGKRIVLIDRDGKIHSLSRQIDGVKAKDIQAKLQGLELPELDAAREQTSQGGSKEPQPQQPEAQQTSDEEEAEAETVDRDQQDRDWQESIIDAGIEHDQKQPPAKPRPSRPQPRRPEPSPFRLNALQDRQIAELGTFYTKNASARLKMEATFEKQYGEHERSLRRDIEHLENVLETSGRLRLGWLKLTRQIPKNPREELDNLRRSLDNIEWRKSEAVSALNSDVERQRQAIEAHHAEERQRLQPNGEPQLYDEIPEPFAYRPDDGFDEQPDDDFGPSFEF
ncbi:MAG: relaxase/mobilization nuclease domain-containing protein [Acidobacteria bacterium]|nr:relaxase/mobilization nuclease domain-containing protein [Acidobacteriota bacterium]